MNNNFDMPFKANQAVLHNANIYIHFYIKLITVGDINIEATQFLHDTN